MDNLSNYYSNLYKGTTTTQFQPALEILPGPGDADAGADETEEPRLNGTSPSKKSLKKLINSFTKSYNN